MRDGVIDEECWRDTESKRQMKKERETNRYKKKGRLETVEV